VKFQFRLAASDQEADRTVEHRVAEQPGLDQLCLRNAEIGVQRLEAAIVQQRHLYRRIDGQRVVQQCPHFLVRLRV
jgi:hypothetical protein